MGSVKVVFASSSLHVERLLFLVYQELPEKKKQMKDFNCGLTGNIRALVRSTRVSEMFPFGRQKPKRVLKGEDSWKEYMQILQDWFKVGKWRKLFLHSGCCWFYLTQPSSRHFIRIKDQLSMFTGSLTTSSSSTQQLLFSRLPYGQQPSFYDFLLTWGHKISSSLGKKTQAVALWNVFLCFCVSVSVEMFASGLKRYNKGMQSEATPWHTYCLLANPGRVAHKYPANTLKWNQWQSALLIQT